MSAPSLTQLSVGVVGAGRWGQNLIRAFAGAARCRLAAICELDAAKLEAQRGRAGVALTAEFEALLRDPAVDAVVLATPAATHHQLAIRALSANKHVFVEKPLALSLRDAEAIGAAAGHSRGRVMTGHILLFQPALQELKRRLEAGEWGSLESASAERTGRGIARDEGGWWSLGPHEASLALWLMGAPRAVTARAEAVSTSGQLEAVSASFRYGGGRRWHTRVSSLSEHKSRRLELMFEGARVRFDESEPGVLRVDDGRRVSTLTSSETRDALSLECQHFVDALVDGAPLLADLEHALGVIGMLAAAERSARAGGDSERLQGAESWQRSAELRPLP